MFSFGGTCAKLINPYFAPEYISCFRFVFGVFFLLILKAVKGQRFGKDFAANWKLLLVWLVFGAVAKWGNYLTENYGFSLGPSYGNIVAQPAQCVFLTLTGLFLFREKLSPGKIMCIVLCMCGVLCISWNGRPLEEFFQKNILITGLFVFSGICAGSHVLAQKMINDRMDVVDSNLSIFAIAAVLSAVPLIPKTAAGALAGIHPGISCFMAILMLGFITGIGFYLNAKAIPLVPLYMVPVIQSTMVIFAILWGVLFFHESVTVYVAVGTAIFMVGLIGLQILNKKG